MSGSPTERPKVSLGMPVFNGEELLPEALDSILAQTFTDFEVVISDNASTDSTPEICRAYMERDPRIRYERAEVGITIHRNFNRAFHLSRGEYFKWHAHDDLLGPEFLSRCVAVLDEDPTTLLVGSQVGLIEKDGSRVPFDTAKRMFVTSYGEQIPRRVSPKRLASRQPLQRFRSVLFEVDGTVLSEFIFGLFRSNALAATPLVEGYIGAAKVLLGRLSLTGRIQGVPEELFFRRYRQGRQGGSGKGTWRGRIRVAKAFAPERRLIVFPFARQVAGYLQVIRGSDVGWSSKIRCGGMVVEKVWGVGVERARRMANKLRKAATSR